jgi:hypothetical protein
MARNAWAGRAAVGRRRTAALPRRGLSGGHPVGCSMRKKKNSAAGLGSKSAERGNGLGGSWAAERLLISVGCVEIWLHLCL